MARFDRTIPPGGEGQITLELRTAGYRNKLHKTARVFSNDPKHPKVIIGLKGKIWVPIDVKPRYARLTGTKGSLIEKVLKLRGNKKEQLVVKLASVSIPDKVDVSIQENKKDRTFELKVKNKVNQKARYTGELRLTTNYPEKPELVIKIKGDIRGLLEVKPGMLNFGRVSRKRLDQLKNTSKSMIRSVTVRLNEGDNLKINKMEMEKSIFRVSTKQIQAGRAVQILVEPILEKLKKGTNQDRLKIHTNQKGSEVLEIPVRLELFVRVRELAP